MLRESTNAPQYPHISVGASLVPALVSRIQISAITTGGHKILPYDVVEIGSGLGTTNFLLRCS
jgi:hypothetical protein